MPATHYLESWSDTRSYDGTVTIVQPLIEPLYASKSVHELLALFSDQYDKTAYDIVRDYWAGQKNQVSGAGVQVPAAKQATPITTASKPSPADAAPATPAACTGGALETWWRKCVHDGFIPNTGHSP